MRSTVPDGDLAAIIEEAITEKLERLEAKRFGKTKAPRKNLKETKTLPSSRYIPAAVKRAVYKRDNGQCTYVDPNGRRCSERHRLEFDHRKPYGRGGDHSVDNIRLLCRTHNGFFAERDYGKEVVERYKLKTRTRGRVSEPKAVYTYGNRATRPSRVKPAVV
jgi:5-methylcytosine-specific restriction endonuclease McrA